MKSVTKHVSASQEPVMPTRVKGANKDATPDRESPSLFGIPCIPCCRSHGHMGYMVDIRS